ncbi:acyl-CoA desaturase [Corallococcus sp. H22C18031201]|uniref:acyl-CoA desaturase n=1 Tax=Citreicoccus inhibens TaxID=2849499 RepID=UPI000E752195|nr:fatty acid desaturase [Citreicoccus inhibens]MBU8896459.1 fatty acid desaturase [Citreicoccus inhibens]RJS18822.1 acyl-CoA desaturase [Corallococcus sp. H22C18031201]
MSAESPRFRVSLIIVVYMLVVHALAASAFVLPWPPHALPVALTLYVAMGLGTTVGLHRLICHRAFECPRWVEYGLVTVAMLTGQGSPLLWAATHRIHHAKADTEGDVHSPERGLWYAHMGWILNEASTDDDAWRTWCKDLAGDRYYHWLLRFRLGPQVIAVLVLGLTLGWRTLPAYFFLPMVSWMQSTYAVNSVCHARAFGTRVHDTRDHSRNVWWVSVLALGEGWHNNHHAFPASARHGWVWWQVDVGWTFIRCLRAVGLARQVHLPTPNLR